MTDISAKDFLFAVEKPDNPDEPIRLVVFEDGRSCAIELSDPLRAALIRELQS